MSRESKGARLYLRTGRTHPRTGKAIPDVWFIRDGSVQISTGCGADRRDGPDGAEAKLSAYIASKWAAPAPSLSAGDPAAIPVAEVLAFYLQKKAPKLARPADTASRVKVLLEWWDETKTLADVKMSTCEAYVEHRTAQPLKMAKRGAALEKRCTEQGARRELEDLSAAITFYGKEFPLTYKPLVSLPAKGEGSRDALSRAEAAALLRATMGHRKDKDGSWSRADGRARTSRLHLRRFALIGLYTGTRPGVIPRLLWAEAATQAWVDLDKGIIYRRGKREKDKRTKKRPLVKIPRRLLAHMRRWRRLDLEKSQAQAEAAKARGDEVPQPLLTVLHHDGEPITGRIRTGFASCVADAGLDPAITPHWMRHTCATWLMQGGVEPWEAAGYAGMTTAVLESHYAHHQPDHHDRARKALGGRR
jgi:integrase